MVTTESRYSGFFLTLDNQLDTLVVGLAFVFFAPILPDVVDEAVMHEEQRVIRSQRNLRHVPTDVVVDHAVHGLQHGVVAPAEILETGLRHDVGYGVLREQITAVTTFANDMNFVRSVERARCSPVSERAVGHPTAATVAHEALRKENRIAGSRQAFIQRRVPVRQKYIGILESQRHFELFQKFSMPRQKRATPMRRRRCRRRVIRYQ